MKPNVLGLIVLTAIIAVPLAVFAAVPESTTTVVPYGDWLVDTLKGLTSVFVAVISWLVANYAPDVLKSFLTNDVITKAVDYGVAAVAGAEHGKTVDVTTANKVIASAANFAVANKPKISKWMGDQLKPLIAARLAALQMLPADAHAGNLNIH